MDGVESCGSDGRADIPVLATETRAERGSHLGTERGCQEPRAKSQEPSRAGPFSAQLGELGTGSTGYSILISLNNEPSYQSINHHRFVSFSLCTLQVPCWEHVR